LLVLAIVLAGFSFFSVLPVWVTAQNVTISFTPEDVFEIPNGDGSICFSVNGTYTNTVLKDNAWVFTDLSLNGSRFRGNLTFSAKNCEVTIHSFRSGRITYSVEKVGEQLIQLDSILRPTSPSEWSVINQDDVFFGDGKNWQLLKDNTILVKGLLGTLTVVHYNFGIEVDNRPFYMQHSIIILTGVSVAIVVTVATIIKLKTKPEKS
jgi:hypothetical protein